MTRRAVQSTNIAEVGYENGVLEVAFKNKEGGITSVYDYEGVPTDVAAALEEDPSAGTYFAAHIKGRYPFVKVQS